LKVEGEKITLRRAEKRKAGVHYGGTEVRRGSCMEETEIEERTASEGGPYREEPKSTARNGCVTR
jgi:hypothetical protein